MRIFAWSAIGLLGLCACTAKDRERGTEAGGASGSSQGGASGSGAGGSTTGGSTTGGSAGATGGSGASGGASGGSGGSSAGSSSGGAGAGGTAGAGGSGGGSLTCTTGPVYTLAAPSSGQREPNITLATCADTTYVIVSGTTEFHISRVRLSTGGSPVEQSWSYSQTGYVEGATCDANYLTLLAKNESGFRELRFPRAGRELATPLDPQIQALATPPECVDPNGRISNVVASYNGGLHAAFDCQHGTSSTIFAGWPPIAVETGSDGDNELQVTEYAFAGGIHFIMNESGQGWVGATAAQLTVRQQLAYEDPINRPTLGAMVGANSAGFQVVGITTNPPPSLLPGRFFSGPVLPSEVNKLFVGGGGLPPTIKLRREFTDTSEFGPASALSTSAGSSFFSFIGLDSTVRATMLGADGSILAWATPVYTPVDVTVRRTYATHGDGFGYGVVWAEYDKAGDYVVKGRSMICL